MQKVVAIESICRDYNTPLRSAALQFPLMHPPLVSVIPGEQTVVEMRSNIEAFHSEIPSELWVSLKESKLIHPKAVTF